MDAYEDFKGGEICNWDEFFIRRRGGSSQEWITHVAVYSQFSEIIERV